MSQKARKRKAKIKKVSFKDKDWYKIIAPKSFNFKPIGDVLGVEGNLDGRTIENLLYDFTDDYSDISLKLKFKIVEINPEAKSCKSIFIGHQYTNYYIRSLISRGSSKIQSIINLKTKDEYTFRLTVVCTTIRRARSSQQILIRKIMREILREFARSLNHEKFITGMIFGEFQNQILRVAKTVYPLSSSTIIKSKLVQIPEGGEDQEFIPKETDFDIVEIDVKRSRKSEIKRTERINVKKLARARPESKEIEEEEEIESELEEELEEIEEEE
jgi:small subunit ribosomal protein S3Ae